VRDVRFFEGCALSVKPGSFLKRGTRIFFAFWRGVKAVTLLLKTVILAKFRVLVIMGKRSPAIGEKIVLTPA
jgi:hypothetical protein